MAGQSKVIYLGNIATQKRGYFNDVSPFFAYFPPKHNILTKMFQEEFLCQSQTN